MQPHLSKQANQRRRSARRRRRARECQQCGDRRLLYAQLVDRALTTEAARRALTFGQPLGGALRVDGVEAAADGERADATVDLEVG